MDLRRKQELFLDGVEESFKFLEITYNRLIDTLKQNDPSSQDTSLDDAIILDCWTIIDHAKRLRTLLENTPGLKKTLDLQLFLNRTQEIPDFRHHVQHLEEKVKDIATTGFPIWGSVSWVKLLPENQFVIGTYVPGRLAKCKGIPVVNPAGRIFHSAIDHIELSVGKTTINISELIRTIEEISHEFKRAVSEAEESDDRDNRGMMRFGICKLKDNE